MIGQIQDEMIYSIQNAQTHHMESAKKLADVNRTIFGFIPRGAFVDSYNERELLVIIRQDKDEKDEEVIGFLRYHHRIRDLQTTLYDICVAEKWRGKRFGQALLSELIQDCQTRKRELIVLKCPTSLPANTFYANQGFKLVGTINGKRQNLNVWQFNIPNVT